MNSFSFASVSVFKTPKAKHARKATLKARRKAQKTATKQGDTLPVLTDAIARLIDPEAFAEVVLPSYERLEAELADARREIAALKEEIDWLTARPSTPEGEYNAIVGEHRQQLRRQQPVRDLVLIKAAVIGVHSDEIAVQKRQATAMARSRMILTACKKVLGNRKTLTIVKNEGKARFFARHGGL